MWTKGDSGQRQRTAGTIREAPGMNQSVLNVLHLYAGNRFGGVENYLLTLVRSQSLCPKMVSSFGLCFEGELSDSLRSTGVQPFILGGARLSRPWTVWKVRRRLWQLMQETVPDVVFCHSYWPQVVFGPTVLKAGIPLAYRSTDLPRGAHWMEKLAARVRPRLVIANSRQTARAVALHMYPDVDIRVVYNPVDNRVPEDRESLRVQMRRELGVEPGQTVFFTASRMVPLKGLHVLLDALGRIAYRRDWTCWIAGGAQSGEETAYLDKLQKTADGMGIQHRVRFLGHRQDIPHLLCAVDVYCQPNTKPDAFGIAFVEALYAGLPVLTSEIGGAVEIVDDSCGILLPPGEVDALVGELEHLLDDPGLRDRLSRGGPSRAHLLSDPGCQMHRLHEALGSVVHV